MNSASPQGIVSGLMNGVRKRLPSILQTEAAECGLACLAMIACHHGHDVDLPTLRRKFSTSIKGANLTRVMSMAAEFGLVPRPLRLDMEDLAKLKTPCILHWDLDHFVVLKKVAKTGIVIHDPARGVCHLTFAEASRHFTGVALELSPRSDFKPVIEREVVSLRALTGRVTGLWRALGVILGLALAIEAFALIGPLFSQWILDQVLVSGDGNLLWLLVIVFGLVTAFQVTLTAARAWSVTWISNSMYAQWSTNLFGHLLKLPLDWFGKRHVGDIVSRFNSIQSIQQTLTTSFATSLLDGLMVVATLGFMFLYSASLSAIVAGVFAVYAGIRWLIFAPLRKAQEEQLVFAARQQSEMLESIRAITAIKLANKAPERLGRFANATVGSLNRGIAVQRLKIAFDASNQFLFGFLRLGIIALGAKLVLAGEFSAGMLVAFAAYADQFINRATSLIDKIAEFRMLKLHAERIADVALTQPEANLHGDYHVATVEQTVELRNVSYRYSNGDPWVLRHCSLRIEAGESVAIVGPSGCGKSTLAKIVLGLLEPTEGEVLVGGVDIRKLGLERYRSMICAVMQEDTLFAGSIADNIAFFDADATQIKIELTAKLAAIHDDIVAMPLGYNTLVGDMGSALSGGQKQRVILARALYRSPKILVLDEATSHLDVDCERQINTAIAASKSTRIVIAHRPETIASVDRVITLDASRILPSGSGAGLSNFHANPDHAHGGKVVNAHLHVQK